MNTYGHGDQLIQSRDAFGRWTTLSTAYGTVQAKE